MKIAIILGTRPEIIKFSPIIKGFIESNISFIVIHTNQHYSINMDELFFKELQLPTVNYNLNVGSASNAIQTARMLIGISEVFDIDRFTHIFIQGDTNSTLAGAIFGSKENLPVLHLEAGLRSFDRKMPEEVNRILADHISDFLFVPTEKQKANLLKEGISRDKIIITGNTITDAISENISLALNRSDIISELELDNIGYGLLTLHRPSNVDNKETLAKIINNFIEIQHIFPYPIIFPIHPRTSKKLKEFDLYLPGNIKVIEPVGYLDMLRLIQNSKILFTDSGGLQEEGCILGIPTITIRKNTERPETVDTGANKLVGHSPNLLKSSIEYFSNNNLIKWDIPYFKQPTEKIIQFIKNMILNDSS